MEFKEELNRVSGVGTRQTQCPASRNSWSAMGCGRPLDDTALGEVSYGRKLD